MFFFDYVLETPSYVYQDRNGNLIKPTFQKIYREFLMRINIFKDFKNWLPFLSWFWVLCLMPFFLILLSKFELSLSFLTLVLIGFFYGMVILCSHGTFWFHRYCVHNTFTFKNSFWRFIGQHLVIKVVPEEVYVVSHHIHHLKSDKPGDPYNAFTGFFYCFFADTNHLLVNRNLSEEDFNRAQKLMAHTGCKINSYEEYKKYGTLVNPMYILLSWVLNWTFWAAVFYLLGEYVFTSVGGFNLIVACFAGTFVWAFGIRTFNYEGQGKGKSENGWCSSDFNRANYSINQIWPGNVAGEWHNNHYLFPTSSRCGFLSYQIDIPFYLVKLFNLVGGISNYLDDKGRFLSLIESKKIEIAK